MRQSRVADAVPRESAGARSAEQEVLVGAWRVLARPLVQLLAEAAAGAVHVETQAAVLVAELVRAVGLLQWLPEAGGRGVRGLLDDVRGALGGGAARDRQVLTGVPRLELAVAAGSRHELELLVGLSVAGPLVDRGAGGRAGAVHVQAQAV